ncbi:hypothetical protein QZH41_009348, partial [Actinostola sp. cb2023]
TIYFSEGENVQPLIHITTVSSSSDQNVDDDHEQNESQTKRAAEFRPRPKSMDDYADTATALALSKLRHLLHQLDEGEVNSVDEMKEELSQSIAMMDIASMSIRDYRGSISAISDIDEELYSDVVSDEVREWIATTFARGQGPSRRKSVLPRHTFRGVVHAVKASLYVNKILKNVSDRNKHQVPLELQAHFEKLDQWTFDVFSISEATDGHSLRYMGYEVLNRLELLRIFKVNDATLDRFLQAVEEGYKKNCNPYHNEIHAADVTHTVFYFLSVLGLAKCLSDLEIFALLISAIIHDLEHTGTTNAFHINSGTYNTRLGTYATNAFHINSRSDLALMYNDRSVLENHHISSAFKILQDNDRNILSNLNAHQYRLVNTRAEQSRAEQSRAEQSRAEQSRAEQSRAEQSRAEQSREQSRAEQSRAEQSRAEQSRAEQSRAEQSRAEQRAEQSRAEQSRAEQSRAEQSRAEQSRAEQSRAEQSRAEQSRAEQSRAEQSRAEQSRAEQSRYLFFPLENGEVIQLILHVADISNPTKDWTIHQKWTEKIMEEFFTQGDMEVELGLDVSPLCDRSVTRIPESQVGFIDVIVTPAFEVCSELLEVFLRGNSTTTHAGSSIDHPWSKPLANNKKKWKEQCQVIN